MDKNKENVPQIRFPEFTDPWEQRKLGEISDKVTEKNIGNFYNETLTNSAEFGIVTQRDFFDKDISNAKSLNGYYVVQNDDFIYNPRISNFAPVGPIKRNKLARTGVMSPLYYVFRTYDIDKTYLEHYFDTTCWHSFMKLNGDSGARADRFAIKDSVFIEMPIPFPNLEEQKKIGKFFDTITILITLHQHKLEHIQDKKKGLLQKMFPKEGEKFPEVRFPGFTDPWEQRKLEDVTQTITKGTTPIDKNWIGPVNYIKTESIDKESGNLTRTSSTSTEEHEGFLKRSQLMTNDVLFSIVGTLGRVGLVQTKDLPANTNQQIAIIRLKGLNPYFVMNVLKSPSTESFISCEATIGAQPSLSLWQINKLEISVPSIIEQEKIGNFFLGIDNLITLHKRKLEHLQQQKKGLLQQMFI
jgi:type I restriction enzyme S subunit